MAIPIKSIPILKGEIAKTFIANADFNFTYKRGTIDFSKQTAIAKKILLKAKI